MFWLIGFVLLTLVGASGTVINVNRSRLERRFAQEFAALVAVPPTGKARVASGDLPPPVARYRRLAVGNRAPVGSLRLSHGGTFRMSPEGQPRPIRGTQVFTADPPGFCWLGTIRIAPGVWVHARDMLLRAEGSMLVLIDDTVTLADVRGPELDQGAALRLLAEMAWYPTALFDARSVSWTSIDADHALATLHIGAIAVSGIFEFGPDGLPLSIVAQRYMENAGLRAWRGSYRDWRSVSGMRVPFEADVEWQLDSGPYTYAHWTVDSLEYDGDRSGADLALGEEKTPYAASAAGGTVPLRTVD
jgi:uncharacterized protein DUF6544